MDADDPRWMTDVENALEAADQMLWDKQTRPR
jgi:hypothetical protein